MFHAWKVLSMSVHLYLYIFSIARWTIWKCQLLNDPSGEMMETYKQQSYCTRQPLHMFPWKNATDAEVLRSFGTRLAKLSFFFFGLMIRSVWHRPSWNDVSGVGHRSTLTYLSTIPGYCRDIASVSPKNCRHGTVFAEPSWHSSWTLCTCETLGQAKGRGPW